MDSVSVEQINTVNDAALNAVTLNTVLSLGTYPIAGSFKNIGANPITSIDLNWQANGGAIHTQSLTGLNINPGQTYNFSHTDQWTLKPVLTVSRFGFQTPTETIRILQMTPLTFGLCSQ
jgi:hypothetical protein